MMCSGVMIAAIVSSAAKMFLAGGGWLPDEVPNSAIYDTALADGKEVRLTTNVQAAVASCYSGLLERALLTGSLEEDEVAILENPDLRRTNNLYRMLGTCSREFEKFGWPENRKIGTIRLTDRLNLLRDELRLIANSDMWGRGYHWGSTLWNWNDDPPTWDWMSDDPLEDFKRHGMLDSWNNVWITFNSCTNDRVWKTSGYSSREHVYSFLSSLYWYGDEEWHLNDDLLNYIRTNKTDVCSCYDILEERAYTNAVKFADGSSRLIYHKLGAIETAIRAMDRTFSGYVWMRDYQLSDLTYRHTKSMSTQAETVSAEIDFARGKISFSTQSKPQWQVGETWSTVTNFNWQNQYSAPLFLCEGDRPKGTCSLSVSMPVNVTKEMLDQIFEGHDFGSYQAARLQPVVQRSDLLLRPSYSNAPGARDTNFPFQMMPFTRVMTTSISRDIRVAMTTSLTTNREDVVSEPSELAFRMKLPSVRIYSGELRLMATNHCPNIDRLINDGGYDCSDVTNRGITVESRLVKASSSAQSKDSFVSLLNKSRASHYNDVRQRLVGYLGCGLDDREGLIPIEDDAFLELKNKMEKVESGNLSWETDVTEIAVVAKTIDGWAIRYQDPHDPQTIHEMTVTDDTPVTVGRIGMRQEDLDMDVRAPEGRPPCGAEGQFKPFYDVKWRFRNLYEEE